MWHLFPRQTSFHGDSRAAHSPSSHAFCCCWPSPSRHRLREISSSVSLYCMDSACFKVAFHSPVSAPFIQCNWRNDVLRYWIPSSYSLNPRSNSICFVLISSLTPSKFISSLLLRSHVLSAASTLHFHCFLCSLIGILFIQLTFNNSRWVRPPVPQHPHAGINMGSMVRYSLYVDPRCVYLWICLFSRQNSSRCNSQRLVWWCLLWSAQRWLSAASPSRLSYLSADPSFFWVDFWWQWRRWWCGAALQICFFKAILCIWVSCIWACWYLWAMLYMTRKWLWRDVRWEMKILSSTQPISSPTSYPSLSAY